MKIVQITDTHLSPGKSHFNGNWGPLAKWVEREQPDLVIHTGDLTIDGADLAEDLAYAKALLDTLGVPCLVVPGNHDVGHAGTAQPVDAARLARWRDLVGPDRWMADRGDWRLIGLNSLLLGLGDDEEAAQLEWLTQALATRGDRRVAVFGHKPLFLDDAGEGETGYWGAQPASRRTLLDLFATHDVALYASGHLHRGWIGQVGTTALVWAPASSFVVGAMAGRAMPGDSVVGAAIHHLGSDVRSELATVPGLIPHLLDDVMDEVYPAAVQEGVSR